METIDAGDVPLDRVVRALFSEVGLRKLIGHHGAACFVLTRSVLAPQFYEQLIQNVDMIDATTRHHIAFIIFHGNRSSFLRPIPGRTGSYYENHVMGLSVSGDSQIRLGHGSNAKHDEVRFCQELSQIVRSARGSIGLEGFARATESASTFLIDRFGIRETALPSLLFVDPMRADGPQAVGLSATEPMVSLYRDVLAPLSDEFRNLEAYWSLRDKHRAYLLEHARALQTLEAFPGELHALRQSHEQAKSEAQARRHLLAADISRLVDEREALVKRCHEFERAGTPEDRMALLRPEHQHYYDQAVEIKGRLAALETKRRYSSSSISTDDVTECLVKLADKINGMWGKLDHVVRTPYYKATKQLRIIGNALSAKESQLERLERTEPSLSWRIEQLTRRKLEAEKAIRELANYEFDHEAQLLAERCDALRHVGYGDEVLQVDRPSAVDVVRILVRLGRIGVPRLQSDKPNEKLRILFLAANPSHAARSRGRAPRNRSRAPGSSTSRQYHAHGTTCGQA